MLKHWYEYTIELCHHYATVLVKDIHDLPRRINEAFYVATHGRPGPVLVDLPKDVTAGIFTKPTQTHHQLYSRVDLKDKMRKNTAEINSIKRVASMINNAKKPVIYAGQGVIESGATQLLKELAEGSIYILYTYTERERETHTYINTHPHILFCTLSRIHT